jgi:Flp pilus assembly protein TadD
MKNTGFARIAATSLVLGFALSGCGHSDKGVASAADSQPASKDGKAVSMSKDLAKLIAKRNAADAVEMGEKLVARQPNHAGYRMQLGESYLLAGRFASAEAAFGDALALSPSDDRAALKLALVKSALGKSQDAQDLLNDHRGTLSASDYGLAMSLAGDPETGATALETAARAQGADARTRQNLALAYAMSGRWVEARTVAAQDLSAGTLDARMTQWAQFAKPRSSWDQVASLLGVRPAQDPGQPVRLALNGSQSAPVRVAAARQPSREPAGFASNQDGGSDQAPVFELSSLSPVKSVDVPPSVAPAPVFKPIEASRPVQAPLIAAPSGAAKRRPIVETIGKPVARPSALAANSAVKKSVAPAAAKTAKPVAVAAVAAKKPVQVASVAPVSVGGRYVVQLGAYSTAKAADQAWASAKSKVPALASYTSSKTSVQSGSASLQRLSASGIKSKTDADALCAKVKASGGNCFVREGQDGAAVQMAAKKTSVKLAAKAPAKPTVKVASR